MRLYKLTKKLTFERGQRIADFFFVQMLTNN